MKKIVFCFLFFLVSPLFASDFTVASYNCGGLSDHYDYIRAVCMHKLVQERCNAEPDVMQQLERVQNVALKILFSKDQAEVEAAQELWQVGGYALLLEKVTAHPDDAESINAIWRKKSQEIVTNYDVRPVLIHDEEVRRILADHMSDLTRGELEGSEHSLNEWLDLTRSTMAERIFTHQLKYDILCLQEADYLDKAMFPEHYAVEFSDSAHSVNGVAWNRDRFSLLRVLGDIDGQGFVVQLRDCVTNKSVLVASAHLTGCNPFTSVIDSTTGKVDSERGDRALQEVIERLDQLDADLKVVAMDSNVTATHPRLSLLRDADYLLDYKSYLGATCTSPWQVLNTRIDWIAVKSSDGGVEIANIPVLGVHLNSPQTNVSDHKPVAARLRFSINF